MAFGLAGGALASNDAQAKKPWALSTEERIALRTDAALARERVREDGGVKAASASSQAAASQTIADSFTGKTHPELFLPYEVFEQFIGLAFTSPPRGGQIVREGFLPEIRRHGFPENFWERLRSISAIYVSDLLAQNDLLGSGRDANGKRSKKTEQALTIKRLNVCRSRAAALAAARNEFGREQFDRFLYEVMAVNMFHVSDRLTDPAVLRDNEEGCR